MEINKYVIRRDNLPVVKEPKLTDRKGVLQVFLNTDMRLQIPGLTLIAKKNNIDVMALAPGQYLVFLNRAKTYLKMFAGRGVLAAYRSPSGRLETHMIQEIPRAFDASSEMNFEKPLRLALEAILTKKKHRAKSAHMAFITNQTK